ncbi:GTP-binding protein [Streptomyces lydicamycinicus]|uniref:GTP-binding protein n=1 Tax=Streptomyces lydicamycinicus TaxID=1546107 RepID=UPI003C2B7C0E
MDSTTCEAAPVPLAQTASRGVKIAVAGGFGAGKTTFVGAVSEITPMRTEAEMTAASIGTDDLSATPSKRTTTVGFDFGRAALSETMVLYLFGAPGQDRFKFVWDTVFNGALGAVVLVDTRRVEDSFPSLDLVEDKHLPYVVAHNVFGHEDQEHTLDNIREALQMAPGVPVMRCDARDRQSVQHVLIALVQHVLRLAELREGRA